MKQVMISHAMLFAVIFLAVSSASAQDIDVVALLARQMDEIRDTEVPIIDDRALRLSDPGQVIMALTPYEEDSSPRVRYYAYTLAWQIAMQDSEPVLRRQVTEKLLQGYTDPTPLVWQHAGQYLLSFTAADFTEGAKATIRQLVTDDNPRRETALLAGVAGLQGQISELRALVSEETGLNSATWYGTRGWYARLALARLGSQEDVTDVIERVESHPDPVIRVTRLLGDIAYTRQPAAIQLLQRYLESDERLPSLKANAPGSRYCQYALDFLAQSIEDFPVESVGPGYSEAEIDSARAWMRAQTQFKIMK